MQDKVFLDTNIFIYSIDASLEHNRKRDVARQISKMVFSSTNLWSEILF